MNAIVVGRFQPFHLGHIEALRYVLAQNTRLSVCIGSSNVSADSRNPFSAGERREMIESSLDSNMLERITICEIPDYDDHGKWLAEIERVTKYDIMYTNDSETARMLERYGKKSAEIPMVRRERLEGSKIRNIIAEGGDLGELVPPGTLRVLERIGARDRLVSFK